MQTRLTHIVACAGCASKVGSDVLAQVLRDLPPITDPRVLVATATADDAGVYQLSDDVALVQTVDFFTPIVDDPSDFGRIAAANALSDVYAMGGRPISALAIATFPEEGLDRSILSAILTGGAEKAREAGVSVIGGHTVKDPEPKYGLAVTGLVHPARMVRNSTARSGDLLVLTKPIGTGILTTSRRSDAIELADLAPAIASMKTLNRPASEAMTTVGVNAATDVTGFGLIGHLREMCEASGTGADIDGNAVPLFDRVVELAQRGCVPGGTRENHRSAIRAGVRFADELPEALRLVMCDAQTSGGLLLSVAEEKAQDLLAALTRAGIVDAAIIGAMTAAPGIRVA